MAELLAQRADVLAQHLPSPRVAATVAVGFTATGLVLLVTRSRQRGRPGTAVVTTPEELQRLLWRGRAAAALASLCGAPVAAVRLPPCSLLLGALPARLLAALPALRELDLPRAGLTALPGPALGALSALTRLALAGNQLEALPPQLGALSALIDLDVSHNHLAALPEEIGDLASLQFLNAQGNRLTELPASVGRLAALRRLGLKGNMLQVRWGAGDLCMILCLVVRDIFGQADDQAGGPNCWAPHRTRNDAGRCRACPRAWGAWRRCGSSSSPTTSWRSCPRRSGS